MPSSSSYLSATSTLHGPRISLPIVITNWYPSSEQKSWPQADDNMIAVQYIILADGTTWNISPRTKFLSVPVGNRYHVSADPTTCRYLYPGPRHDSIYSQSTSYLLLMAPARISSRTMGPGHIYR